jgi:hypothetical protein
MHHRLHVRSRLIDRGVDEALQVWRAAFGVDRVPVQAELYEIARVNELGRQGPGQKEPLRGVRVPSAQVSVRIHDAFVAEDAIADDQIAEDVFSDPHRQAVKISMLWPFSSSK